MPRDNLAENEYKDYPPTKYYRDGYNLYKRMLEYKDSHLLFLHDIKVPYDNNLAERLARIVNKEGLPGDLLQEHGLPDRSL